MRLSRNIDADVARLMPAIMPKKCTFGMFSQKTAEIACQEVSGKVREKVHAHHERGDFRGCCAAEQREADGRQVEFADGQQRHGGDEPEHADLLPAIDGHGRQHQHEIAQADTAAAYGHLGDG